MIGGSQTARVKTRRVHYFSGFDPRGAAHYHRLYREEAQKQAVHNKANFSVGPRRRLNQLVSTWEVSSEWNGDSTTTEYQFMHWDDVARENWQRSSWRLWIRGFWPYLKLLFGGYWSRIRLASNSVSLSGAFPMTLFLCFLLLAVFVGLAAGYVAKILNFGQSVSVIIGGMLALLVFTLGLAASEKIGGHWVLRTILFVNDWGRGKHFELENRLKDFVRHLIDEQNSKPVDEVLLVGHSIGSIVAVAVASQISNESNKLERGGMKLLTLGQCIPMLSLLSEADDFREKLKVLALPSSIPWSDVTIPPDPLCFYGHDPLGQFDDLPVPRQFPRLAGARVFRMFRQETYAKLRWNKLRLHFQYLMASELPADYDYFLTTAGPLTLDESLANCEIQSSNA